MAAWPPNRSAFTAGSKENGIASTIATRSARNAPTSTRLWPMYRMPSTTAASPGRPMSSSGGSAGSRATPYNAAANETTSRA